MAKKVDISQYINVEAPEMVLFGKTYPIKSDKKTILMLNELQRKSNTEDMDTDSAIIRLLVGEEKGQSIIDMLESCENYAATEKVVVLNIIALATGVEYEVLEERFRKSQK